MTEIQRKILAVIADITEQPTERILSTSRHLEVVDARHILITLLREHGAYNSQIARICRMSLRAVNHALNNFDNRLKQSKPMRNNLAKIRQQLSYN
jgi:chromosomal replication initiation ATPase DnaA